MRFAAQWFVFIVWWAMVAVIVTTPISIPLAVGLTYGLGEMFWSITAGYVFVVLFFGAMWVGYR